MKIEERVGWSSHPHSGTILIPDFSCGDLLQSRVGATVLAGACSRRTPMCSTTFSSATQDIPTDL
jgi:hypothetical protein